MEFKGQASHAAESPELGRNALNAATLCYTATHMLRQEARRDANLVIHGFLPEAGVQGNIIPDTAVCSVGVKDTPEAPFNGSSKVGADGGVPPGCVCSGRTVMVWVQETGLHTGLPEGQLLPVYTV